MIYEARTYQLKPRGVPEFLELFQKGYPAREKVSKLGALFYTDIGPLNQVIHLWPYRSLADRERKRAQLAGNAVKGWPPPIAHLVEDMTTEIFIPAPFSPKMASGELGPVFEWREYDVLPGMLGEMYANWEKKLARRTGMSPLVMAMHTEIGGLNKFVHIWAYESLDQRSAIRAEAIRQGIWPPKGRRPTLKAQQSKILLAAAPSPLR